ncbi:MAG TPA: HlyD family secretion protein [Sporomusa sp.]|nr:HlyD family secretion protein [Sporomusa sp.]
MGRILLRNEKKIMVTVAITGFALLGSGIWWWMYYANIVSTDDARVKGTIVTVSSRVAARVAELLVDEGDAVQAGQVIARLDSRDLKAQVAQAKAILAAAEAKLAGVKAGSRPQQVVQAAALADSAQASLDNAGKVYERTKSLYAQGAVAAQQLDAAQAALAVALAQCAAAKQSVSLAAEGSRSEDIEAATAQMEQAAAILESAQLQLDYTAIIAPIAGVVALKSVNVGESVSVGQPIFNIVDNNNVWIAANIEETAVGKVRVGQKTTFSVDAFPGKTFTGKVREVGAATRSQFSLLPNENTAGSYTKLTQKLPVKIAVANTGNEELKPGMSAIIRIDVKSY